MDPITINDKGDRKRLLAEHAVIVVALNESGAPVPLRTRADGALATGGIVSAVIVAGSFVRPADTTDYTVGDLVANNTTAGSVTPIALAAARANDLTGRVRRVRLKKTDPSLTNAAFRLHFYKSSPVPANGDNGAFSTTESNYLGSVDVTMDRAFTDGAKGFAITDIIFAPSTGTRNIFALVEARGAYSPVAGETFTLTLEVDQY